MKAKYIPTGQIVDVYLYIPGVLKTEENMYREIGIPSSSNVVFPEKDLDFKDTADWEQRRYEIAKDIIANNPNYSAAFVIQIADQLINKLKEGKA